MTNGNDDSSFGRRGLTLVADGPNEGTSPGPGHRHAWELVTIQSGLQAAHLAFGWDVMTSRIVGVNRCCLCNQLHRGSVRECRVKKCHAHPICERPNA